ncbi:MAG: glucose-1-phosphate thymidylyltransferase [Candidatus Marinimicrobia bacterium]|nr:glucose-1-phosphate thymidylyltransferase [Candidatus Neomarinimicrobiota bacterium]OUW50284.1 MAG: glucose-1-phosphate thymidylyltransferase [bacterium TMED190]
MKGLLTAGGHGTRLRPITHTKNKHLIPIANQPMLSYAIDYMRKAQIIDIGIIINENDKEIENIFGNGKQYGVNLTYIHQNSPLGLAHVIKISEDFIGKDKFLFYLGDNILVGGVNRFIDEFNKLKSNCHLVLSKVNDPERFGVPEIKNNKIISISEKPKNPKSDYAITGIYLYDSSIFEAVNNIKPSERGELEISDAHQYLLEKNKKITFSEITGWWKDTGKPSDLIEANKLVLKNMVKKKNFDYYDKVEFNNKINGKIIYGKDSIIKKSIINGPVIIGNNVVIENSTVGPNVSLSNNCKVINSRIEDSIVMSGTSFLNIKKTIKNSLLGNNIQINQKNEFFNEINLIIGDQGKIEIG